LLSLSLSVRALLPGTAGKVLRLVPVALIAAVILGLLGGIVAAVFQGDPGDFVTGLTAAGFLGALLGGQR
jgi:hypothetical protein